MLRISNNSGFFLLLFSAALSANEPQFPAPLAEDMNGLDIMQEAYQRHKQFAFIYEEQSMVMMDKQGQRNIRKIRRYSRVEEDGTTKFLLLFDSPEAIDGVAILASRNPEGEVQKYIYLPAFGEQLIENISSGRDGKFLGTDFSIESIAGESLDDYIYVRRPDLQESDNEYFVLDVYEKSSTIDETTTSFNFPAYKRHYVLKNNFYITRTDYFDSHGNVYKQQSHHDIKPVDKEMWRADMILMKDNKEKHQSLLKIKRRVFSKDYVTPDIFTAEWLYKNSPYIPPLFEEQDEEQEQLSAIEIVDEEIQTSETGTETR